MAAQRVAIIMDRTLLAELDRLVAENMFASRSQAVQAAVQEKLDRMRRNRSARGHEQDHRRLTLAFHFD